MPNSLIDKFDCLKKEWGLRARGEVIERLLQLLLNDEDEGKDNNINIDNKGAKQSNLILSDSFEYDNQYNENTALVLIDDKSQISFKQERVQANNSKQIAKSNSRKNAIDLPGFVRKKTEQLKTSLSKDKTNSKYEEPILSSFNEQDITKALKAASHHWLSLYGQRPKDTVIEAAMTWLALDIWSQIEGSENIPFTWTAANKLMEKYSSCWECKEPNFERIIVIAGFLEDPFGALTLPQRMPSLIRRFVNKFKKSQKVTSFQTLESTMTVHGALKLLDLPTYAGASLTLLKIRESYKEKALSMHPDAGGSTDSMRRLNEAYQLLKELYREKL